MKGSLRKLISEKTFSETEKLPPEGELARQLMVSRVTVYGTLMDLEQKGLLLRIHGRGTFVNPAARQVEVNLSGTLEFGSIISRNGYQPECRLVSMDRERVPASVGEHLGTGKGGRGIRVEKLYLAGDIPAVVNVGRIPLHLFSETPARTD